MPAKTILLRLAPALALAAAASIATPASAAPAAALPCIDVGGIVVVNCPVPAPVPPTSRAPTHKHKRCADATLLPTAADLPRLDKATLCLVNRERTKRHLVALKRQPALDGAATRFAEQLVRERFFDHTAPDGTTMVERVKRTTYLTSTLRRWWLGENIAYGTGDLGTPRAIVKAWMHSPGHRANILDRRFREIGLGVVVGSPGGPSGATYVHDFGRRER